MSMSAPNYAISPDGRRITLPMLRPREYAAMAETARQISPSCGVQSLLVYAINPELVPVHVRAAIEAWGSAWESAHGRKHPHLTARPAAVGARIFTG